MCDIVVSAGQSYDHLREYQLSVIKRQGLTLADIATRIGDRRMAFHSLPRLSFQNLTRMKQRLHEQK